MRSYSHELALLTHTAFLNYERFRELGLGSFLLFDNFH